MTAPRAPPTSWRELLRTALVTPGLVHEAYNRFHRYSLHNQLLALAQCAERGIAPGPLRTFAGWRALGRSVRRGERAIVLCVPFTRQRGDEELIAGFGLRARWFALSQTDGDDYTELEAPTWSEEHALKTLEVQRAPFTLLDGNVQGYVLPGRRIAISPVAALPHKTLFHELAHILLAHAPDDHLARPIKEAEAEAVALLCVEALGLPGSEYARGYVQTWLQQAAFSEESSQRVIQAAQEILAAGAQDMG